MKVAIYKQITAMAALSCCAALSSNSHSATIDACFQAIEKQEKLIDQVNSSLIEISRYVRDSIEKNGAFNSGAVDSAASYADLITEGYSILNGVAYLQAQGQILNNAATTRYLNHMYASHFKSTKRRYDTILKLEGMERNPTSRTKIGALAKQIENYLENISSCK